MTFTILCSLDWMENGRITELSTHVKKGIYSIFDLLFFILRYRLSGQVMPQLRDWMMATVGISLDHKTPAQVKNKKSKFSKIFLVIDHADHPKCALNLFKIQY